MSRKFPPHRLAVLASSAIAVVLALGWASREAAFAREKAKLVESQTVGVDQVKMVPFEDAGKKTGEVGLYIQGDTPASVNFVTGRFVIDPGKSPHPPHVHPEEEVMVIEKGTGEILVDGKTKKVGPGSVMYTTPNVSHGITNLGNDPLTFYFIKWSGRPSK